MHIGGAEVFGVGAIAVAIYQYLKNDLAVQFLAWILGAVVLLLSFESLQYYGQDALQFAAGMNRYCMDSGRYWPCLLTWEYGQKKLKDNEIPVIYRDVIQYKDRPVYIKLHEDALLSDDLNHIHAIIGSPINQSKAQLGKMVGVEDITTLDHSTITSSGKTFEQYEGAIRFDGVFKNIHQFDEGCVNSSTIRIIVQNGSVYSLTWIGDIKSVCFDALWQPNIIRARNWQSIEEIPSGDHTVDRYFRYYDSKDARDLAITSRYIENGKSHIGVRISVIAAGGTMPVSYANFDALKTLYRDVDNISAIP